MTWFEKKKYDPSTRKRVATKHRQARLKGLKNYPRHPKAVVPYVPRKKHYQLRLQPNKGEFYDERGKNIDDRFFEYDEIRDCPTPKDKSKIYRGMSREEFENSKKRGYFKSDQKAQKKFSNRVGKREIGTGGSTNILDSASYAIGWSREETNLEPKVDLEKGKTPVIVGFEKNKKWKPNRVYIPTKEMVEEEIPAKDFIYQPEVNHFKDYYLRKGKIPTKEVKEVWDYRPTKYKKNPELEFSLHRTHERTKGFWKKREDKWKEDDEKNEEVKK